jgi:arabinogalactan oligomer/maltooligosaccharide transport system permease protein
MIVFNYLLLLFGLCTSIYGGYRHSHVGGASGYTFIFTGIFLIILAALILAYEYTVKTNSLAGKSSKSNVLQGACILGGVVVYVISSIVALSCVRGGIDVNGHLALEGSESTRFYISFIASVLAFIAYFVGLVLTYKRGTASVFQKVLLKVRHNFLLFVLGFIWIIPIVWLLCTSFSDYDGMNTSTFFPAKWSLRHYSQLLLHPDTVAQFPRWFMNTLIIAIFTCIISTMFVLMVAYATSIMRFPMRKPLMNIGVMLNLFPGMLSMIAVYFILKSFNLTNNHIGLILIYSASSGLGYLIAKGFFDTVPRSLIEAARIDGSSNAGIFFKLILPLSRPIIVYTVISSFLVPWMDFVYAKIILNSGISSKYTVAIGLYKMLDKSLITKYFTVFCCGGVIVSIPISILFVIMQKFYVEGVTGGAVKG